MTRRIWLRRDELVHGPLGFGSRILDCPCRARSDIRTLVIQLAVFVARPEECGTGVQCETLHDVRLIEAFLAEHVDVAQERYQRSPQT